MPTRLLIPALAAVLAAGLPGAPAARAECTLPQGAESAHVPGVAFEELAGRAVAADEAGRAAEAVRYYRAAVDANPPWQTAGGASRSCSRTRAATTRRARRCATW